MRNVSLACLLLGFAFLLMSCRTPDLEAPAVPFGPEFGFLDSTYRYAVVAVDPECEPVAARFCWGHDDTSDWTGLVPHGDTIRLDHTWQKHGTHEVRAQFRDQSSRQSTWSDPLVVYVSEFDFPSRIVGNADTYAGWDIELSPGEDRLWIGQNWHCRVVDTRTMGLVADLHVAGANGVYSYVSLALLPVGELVYAGQWNAPWLSVFRASDFELIDSIPLRHHPAAVVASPDGRHVYSAGDVVGPGDISLLAVSTEHNAVVDSLELEGNNWFRFALMPDGTRLYAVEYYDPHILRIRVPDLTTTDTISLDELDGTVAGGLTLSPGGEYLYAVGEWSEGGEWGPAVVEIRTADDSVTRSVHVGDELLRSEFYCAAPSPDGRYLYVGGNDLHVFQLSDLALVRTIRTPDDKITDIEITNAGDRLYLNHFDGGPLLVVGY